MTKAYRIDDLVATGLFSRTKLYALIKEGKLVARKVGGTTIVLDEDWTRLLQGAPPLSYVVAQIHA